MPIAVLEAVFREDLAWRLVACVVCVALVFTLLWRRTEPLVVVAIAFGVGAVSSIIALIGAEDPVGLYTTVFVVLLPYSLFRWGSGREAVIGLAILLFALVVGVSADFSGFVDAIFAGVFLLFPAALGASVRYRANSRTRLMDQVKLLEREQLARELHDTVAHHVSAIAIRAQAGRVVAATDPAAALEALIVIEQEASRTLAEMRAMVGALRQGEEADLTPQRGVADIERFTNGTDEGPHVDVELSGNLEGLPASVDAALYRLAQESITNAVRHARHATRIRVAIQGEDDCVRLTVGDDGDAGAFDPRSASGFGLIGMAERAKLLGGTLEAGPNRNRGWTVHAVLPKTRDRS